MELLIDLSKKKELTQKVINATLSLKRLQIISKLLRIIAIVGCVLYGAINFIVPSLNRVNVRGELKKDIFLIVANTIFILVLGLFASMIFHYLLANLSSKDMNERADESIFVTSDSIRYVFRTRYQTALDTRIVFSIPFKDISSVSYDEDLRRITLKGRFSSDVVENYANTVISDPTYGNQSEIVIYDYFEPSLFNLINAHKNI